MGYFYIFVAGWYSRLLTQYWSIQPFVCVYNLYK